MKYFKWIMSGHRLCNETANSKEKAKNVPAGQKVNCE